MCRYLFQKKRSVAWISTSALDPGPRLFTHPLPERSSRARLLILEFGGQVPAIAEPERASLEMGTNKRQKVSLHRMVGRRPCSNRKNGKVCGSVDDVPKDHAAPFSAGDYDEIVTGGERENAKDAIDGTRRPSLGGLRIRG